MGKLLKLKIKKPEFNDMDFDRIRELINKAKRTQKNLPKDEIRELAKLFGKANIRL